MLFTKLVIWWLLWCFSFTGATEHSLLWLAISLVFIFWWLSMAASYEAQSYAVLFVPDPPSCVKLKIHITRHRNNDMTKLAPTKTLLSESISTKRHWSDTNTGTDIDTKRGFGACSNFLSVSAVHQPQNEWPWSRQNSCGAHFLPARFGQDAGSPGQGCHWTISWTGQVQSCLVKQKLSDQVMICTLSLALFHFQYGMYPKSMSSLLFPITAKSSAMTAVD